MYFGFLETVEVCVCVGNLRYPGQGGACHGFCMLRFLSQAQRAVHLKHVRRTVSAKPGSRPRQNPAANGVPKKSGFLCWESL